MAKKNIFEKFAAKVKNWFTGGSGGGSSSAAKTRSASNTFTGQSRQTANRVYNSYSSQRAKQQERERKRKEESEKRKNDYAVAKQEYKSMGVATGTRAPMGDTRYVQRTVKTVNKAVEKSQKNKPLYTGLDGKPTKYSKMARDITESSEREAKAHPRLYKASEGLLSGATLGASTLLESKYSNEQSKKNIEAGNKSAEKKLGKTKANVYSMGGELVGGALTMGGVEKLAMKGASKVAPTLTKQLGKQTAKRFASNKGIQKLAEKKALKELGKAGVKDATEAEIKRVAERKAKEYGSKAARSVMHNVAGDMTGGLLYDVNTSLADSDNAKEFAKNMAVNAGMSLGMGALGNVVASRQALKAAFKNRGVADEVAERAISLVLKDRDNVTKADVKAVSDEIKKTTSRNFTTAKAKVSKAYRKTGDVAESGVSLPARDIRDGAKSADTEVKIAPPTTNANTAKPTLKTEINGLPKIDVPTRNVRRAEGDFVGYSKAKGLMPKSLRGKERVRADVESVSNPAEPIKNLTEPNSNPTNVANKPNVEAEVTASAPTTRSELDKISAKRVSDSSINSVIRSNKLEGDDRKLLRTLVRESEDSEAYKSAMDKVTAEVRADEFKAYLEQVSKKIDTGTENYKYKELVDNINENTPDDIQVSKGLDSIQRTNTTEENRILNQSLEDTKKNLSAETRKFFDGTVRNSSDGKLYRRERVIKEAESEANRVLAQSAEDDVKLLNHLEEQLKRSTPISLDDVYSALALKSKYSDGSNPDITNATVAVLGRQKTEAGQGLAAARWLMKLDPEYRQKELSNYFNELLKKMGYSKEDNFLDDAMTKLYGMSPAKKFEELSKIDNSDDLALAKLEVARELMGEMKPNPWDVINSWRYLSLLSKPSTQLTNILGNLGANGINAADKMFKRRMEKKFAEYGIKRTSSRLTGDEIMLAYSKGDKYPAFREILDSRMDKAIKLQFDKSNSKFGDRSMRGQNYVYEGNHAALLNTLHKGAKGIQKANDAVGGLLNSVDKKFFKDHYRVEFMEYLKANGAKFDEVDNIPKELLDEANDYATRRAKTLTYKDTDAVIETLNRLRTEGYEEGAGFGKKVRSIAIDSQMPFTGVSVNMFKQSLDHSPIGLVRGYDKIHRAVKTSDPKLLEEGIELVCAGKTGTTALLIGAAFGTSTLDFDSIGLVAGIDGDEDSQKYQKMNGVIGNSLKIGDMYFDLSNLNPVSGTFLTGAYLKQMVRGWGEEGFSIEKTLQAMLTPFQVCVDMSFLENINSLLESGQYASNDTEKAAIMGSQILGNYAQQFIPTPIRGLARATVSGDMDLSAHGNNALQKALNYQKNNLQASIPILANKLPKKVNAMGEEVKFTKQGYNGKSNLPVAILKNEIDTFRTRKADFTESEKEILKLRKEMAKKDVKVALPKVLDKDKISVGRGGDAGKEDFDLTPKQQEQARKAQKYSTKLADRLIDQGVFGDGNSKRALQVRSALKGKTYAQALDWVMKQPEYKRADKNGKVEIINHLTNDSIRKYDAQKYVYTKVEGHTETEFRFKQDLPPSLQAKYNSHEDALNEVGVDKADMVKLYDEGYTYHMSDKDGKMYRDFKTKDVKVYLAETYDVDKAAAIYNAIKPANYREWDGVTLSSGRGGKRRRSGGGRSSGGSGKAAKIKLTTSNIKASDYKVSAQNYKSMASGGSSKVFKDSMKIKPKIKLEVKNK